MYTLTSAGAALLSVLHDGPQACRQLLRIVQERYGAFFTVSRAVAYRTIPSLMAAGLVEETDAGQPTPRNAQRYAITAAGRDRFAAWLLDSSDGDQWHSPLLLRMAYSGVLPKQKRQALIEAATERCSAELAAALVAVETAGSDPVARAVAEFGVATAQAMLRLLKSIPQASGD